MARQEGEPRATPRADAARQAPLRARPHRPGDEAALVELFSDVFGRPRSLKDWYWLFQDGPEGPAETYVLACGEVVVGSITHIPLQGWVNRKRVRIARGADMMVAPAFRGRRAVSLLVDAALGADHGFDLNIGTVNASSARVLDRDAGTVALGCVPQWIRFNTRGHRLPRLGRALATFVERMYGRAVTLRRPQLRVRDLECPDWRVDELADASAAFAPCIQLRDAVYMRWHWLEQPGGGWRIRAVEEPDGRLRGIAVSGVRYGTYGRHGVIADLLVRDYEATRALVLDAFDQLAADACTSVSCIYHDPRPWSARAFLRSGFRRIDGPYLGAGSLSPAVGPVVEELANWYVTYGDTDI